jgi:Xaa-Pro aminopeptidase
MRSEKNATEIQGSKNAHIQDGIALIEFLSWFYENGYGKTEFELGEQITEFRKLQDQYIIDSFPPIVGFAENGAKIHYKAKKHSKTIGGNGLVLIDSGGHYYGGTTDVTRTILVGSAHIQWKEYYTRILKGHIALAKIKFPKGLTGANIDILARQYLWDMGEDYAHGTGHGVGNMLSVHEGPARISLFDSKYPIKTGMILSNEPGYYKAGEFGIRIENLQYVKESNLNQKFLEFNQLTLVPYSKDLIVIDLLTRDEIDFLKNYYQKINDSLMLNLSKAGQNYLFAETKIFS